MVRYREIEGGAIIHSSKQLSELQKATLKAEWALSKFGVESEISLREAEEAEGNPYFYRGDDNADD